MATRGAELETYYQADTGGARPGRSIFPTYRMPNGRLVVTMRRDSYEAALEAANTVLRRIIKEQEYLKS